MKFIKKYEDFEPVNEAMGEFGFQGFGVGAGIVQPKDQQLSFDPFDRYAAIKRQQRDLLVQLSSTLRNAHGDSYVDENNLNINTVIIMRMFDDNLNQLNIYLKFVIGDEIFFGTFNNWGSPQPYFKSATFDDVYGNSSVKMKVVGMLKIILNNYFRPEPGNWIVNAGINAKDEWGRLVFIKPGVKIIVDEVITEDTEPKIKVIHEGKKYTIQNINYFWFKWNCEPEPKMPVSNI